MIRRAVLLLLASLLLVAGAGQAAQAAGYRYWSFWERDGDRWVYATQGPSTARPSDGDVQGLRFAVSEDSSDAARPRGPAAFGTICAKTPAKEGTKRVALVLDFGTPADAPAGETPPAARTACARVSPDATTAEALAAVAKPLRYDTNALLCAISGYPEQGCGEQVSEKERKPAAEPQGRPDDGPSLGLVAGIGLVVLLGGAAIWQVRRRG
ncbi:SCO2322 family protein [Streptomyces dubilierae]|uniref:SCO2322 family protein n=1 Tax=Streptomyces dubilierae TaxID=3075533 RepID=A0ABU2PEZ2_9ACTN|nr:SCO2322 family protein [Streptomyces sp. DSM 41921]MDT0390397.1 SCO2322 family protein [Streptomyces sp. DSM 41921]